MTIRDAIARLGQVATVEELLRQIGGDVSAKTDERREDPDGSVNVICFVQARRKRLTVRHFA